MRNKNQIQIFRENYKTQKTFLTKFIKTYLDNYKEPERLGTPRDQQRDFPKKKIFIALMGLTTITQKDIAEFTHVSFGLVRKWNSEERFQEMVEFLCKECVKKFMEKDLTSIIKQNSKLDFSSIKDSFLYSQSLANQIIEYLCAINYINRQEVK